MHFFSLSLDVCPAWHAAAKSPSSFQLAKQPKGKVLPHPAISQFAQTESHKSIRRR